LSYVKIKSVAEAVLGGELVVLRHDEHRAAVAEAAADDAWPRANVEPAEATE